jgi:hypothetical protein
MDYMVENNTGQTAVRYKSIVVWIHWITAAVVVTQVIVGFLFADMERGPQRADLFAWHKTIGATILVLALVRLAVRLDEPAAALSGELPQVGAVPGRVEPPPLLRAAYRPAVDRLAGGLRQGRERAGTIEIRAGATGHPRDSQGERVRRYA